MQNVKNMSVYVFRFDLSYDPVEECDFFSFGSVCQLEPLLQLSIRSRVRRPNYNINFLLFSCTSHLTLYLCFSLLRKPNHYQ